MKKSLGRIVALALALALAPSIAAAQSSPNLRQGQVPTPAQWNSYFAAKQDVLAFAPATIGANTYTGTQTINPATGTTSRGLVVNQTMPTGSVAGPVFGNVLTFINPGLTATPPGSMDAFGQISNQVVGLRINYLSSGSTTASNNIAFGVAHYITAATDAVGGAIGVSSASSAVGGSFLWGFIGYANVRPGGTAGLLIGNDAEVGIATGGSATYRIGTGSDSQGALTGLTLDAAFAATASSNVLPGGGAVIGWNHLFAIAKNVYFSGVSPLNPAGDFFFSDSAITTAHFANLGNVTFTGNYFDFQKMAVRGTDGAAVFGGAVGLLPGSGVLMTCTACGSILVTGVPNVGNGADGVTVKDITTNNIAFFGNTVAAATGTRLGQVQANWTQLFAQGSVNAGLMMGTNTAVPVVIGTANTARLTISGAGALIVGATNVAIDSSGAAVFGGGSLPGTGIVATCSACGTVLISGVPNVPGGDGLTIHAFSGDNVAFFGTSTAATVTSRFGQVQSNFTQVVGLGANNAGLMVGTITDKPVIVGTFNVARLTITSSSITAAVQQIVSLNAAALPTAITGTALRAAQVDGTTSRIVAEGYGAIAALTVARANNTAASPSQVLSTEQIGGVNAYAWGSNAAWNGPIASLRSYAGENITATAWGSKLCLATTPVTTVLIADGLCQNPTTGITLGAPTGGDKGAGTLNAAGSIYVNNAAVLVTGGPLGTPASGNGSNLTALNASNISSGTLALANGGTAAALTASNGGITYSTASALALLAGTATARLPLLSGANTAPVWGAYTIPASVTSGGIPYFSSTTAQTSSALLTANGVVYGGGAGGAPASTAAGTSGQGLLGVTGSAPVWGTVREYLTAARTYYVRTDGNDACNGTTDAGGSSGNCAFLTIQKAVNTTASLDINIQNVTIQVRTGTFAATVLVNGPWVGTGTVSLLGDTATPANCIISVSGAGISAFTAQNGVQITIKGFRLVASGGGAGAAGLKAINGAVVSFDAMDFGAASRQIQVGNGATAQWVGLTSYNISAGAVNHWFTSSGGNVIAEGGTINTAGTPAFSGAFANIGNVGIAFVDSLTFSGTGATGSRYAVTGNGVLYTGGAATTYLPGNAVGTTATGGQYN